MMVHRTIVVVSLLVATSAHDHQLPAVDCESEGQCLNTQRDVRVDQNTLMQTEACTDTLDPCTHDASQLLQRQAALKTRRASEGTVQENLETSDGYSECPKVCAAIGRQGCCYWDARWNYCGWCEGGHVSGGSHAPWNVASRNCHGTYCDGWNWRHWCNGKCTKASDVGWNLPGSRRLIWADEFDGATLNNAWWNVGTLKAANGDIVPGAKGDHNLNDKYLDYIKEDDVLVENGLLRLRAQKRTVDGTSPSRKFHYTAGWVQSMHKVFYTYGYAEARIRFPLGKKIWAAFWTIEERLVWGAEFDIAEYYGEPWTQKNGKPAGLGQHLKTGDWPETHWIESWNAMCDDPSPSSKSCDVTAWHIYGLLWSPEGYDYYIDGQLRKRVTKANVNDFPTKDMYFVLNNGVRASGDIDDTTFPNYVDFDYVRLYALE